MAIVAAKLMHPPRETGQSACHHVEIPSDPAEARRVQDQIEQLLLDAPCSDKELFSIKLALEEALVNAIKHGNQFDPAKKVKIDYQLTADRFSIQITDQGEGFDLLDVPDPTAVENLERPCGRGLMLIKHYMTEVQYNQRGNSVSMAKVFKQNGRK